MAIARPIRALAVVSALLFFYLIFLVLRPTPTDGGEDLENPIPDEPMYKGKFSEQLEIAKLIGIRNT